MSTGQHAFGKTVHGHRTIRVHSVEVGGGTSGVDSMHMTDGTLHLGGTHPHHDDQLPIKMGATQVTTRNLRPPSDAAPAEQYNVIDYATPAHDGTLLRVSLAGGGVSYETLADASADKDVMGYAAVEKSDTYAHGLVREGNPFGARFLGENGEWGFPTAHTGVTTTSLKQLDDFPSDYTGQSGKYLKVGAGAPSGLGVVFGDLKGDIEAMQLNSVTADRVIITSDERAKEEITPFDMNEAAEMLASIEPVQFRYKNAPDRLCYGILAQQLSRVMPDAVIEGEQDGFLRVDYVQLTGLLLGSQKAMLRRVEALEQRVSEM